MPYNWNREYRDVGVIYEDRVVRIANDASLAALFKEKGRRGALALSGHILCRYASLSGRELQITDRSLAAEIYDHYKLQVWTLRFEKLMGRCRPTRWMMRHMEVIDCGEKEVDNNRFLWDLFSILW